MKYFRIIVSIIIVFVFIFSYGCAYDGELVYIDNGSHVYHRDDCKFVKEANKVYFFDDLEHTVNKYCRPCKTCNPPDNIDIAIDKLKSLKQQRANNRGKLLKMFLDFELDNYQLISENDNIHRVGDTIYYYLGNLNTESFHTDIIREDIVELLGKRYYVRGYEIFAYSSFYDQLLKTEYDRDFDPDRIEKLKDTYNIN